LLERRVRSFFPHVRDDQESGKIYLYTLVVIDVATRFKGARSLTSKNSLEVWNAIEEIYNDPNNPLTWPKLLMADGGKEFSGYFSRGMERHNVTIWVVDLYSFESQQESDRDCGIKFSK